MWVGIFMLNIWWSCSINSWLDVILKCTIFSSLFLCFVTEVCRQVLFEWIAWTAWIVLIVYSPSLHRRWVRQRTFHGISVVHTLFHGKDRKEAVSLSYVGLSCQLYDTEWCWLGILRIKSKNTFKNNVGFFFCVFFFLLLCLIQILFGQLESLDLNSKPIVERFVESYKEMWSLNGQNLSRVFSGNRALEGKNKVKKDDKTLYLQVKKDVLFMLQCHLHS